MLIVGQRLIPWALHFVAHTGSRELFRLAVFAIALGVAFGAARLFGVSFALGAFFAGVILAESPFSQRAAQETLPLRDAFAVLFFVSVGMLFDPDVLVSAPLALFATVLIIMVGKSAAAFAIVRLFGHSRQTAWVISASLAQIGEFSFILATLGTAYGLLDADARSLILAAAMITIMLNPAAFLLASRLADREPEPDEEQAGAAKPQGHVVLVGYGRVGRLVGERLAATGAPLLIIETESDLGLPAGPNVRTLIGNGSDPKLLRSAELKEAKLLLVAIPETFEAGQIVEQARGINPGLQIVARAHSDAEVDYLIRRGASRTIMGEREIAQRMIGEALAA